MKFFGKIGFGVSEEGTGEREGIWEDDIVERQYFGDVLSNSRKFEAQSESVLDNLNVSNRISIVADAFAFNHFSNMKYIEWIRENKNVSQAGVYNYYKCVRSFCADAVLFGHIPSNPCDKLVGKVSRGTRFLIEYLTDEELETIITTDMPSQMTEHARDLFIFMCFTGLRYSDLVTFDINNYEIVNGKYQANDEAIKTGRVYVSQLLTPAVKILQKYDFKLPMMSNQKLNFALKGVQVVCGIKKRLHAHLGRHTFATYMLSHGASPQNVMKMLGHTNIQQTMQYAAVLAKDVHADYAKIDEMFK